MYISIFNRGLFVLTGILHLFTVFFIVSCNEVSGRGEKKKQKKKSTYRIQQITE